MAAEVKDELSQLTSQEEVKQALDQTAKKDQEIGSVVESGDKTQLGICVAVAAILTLLLYAVRLRLLPVPAAYSGPVERLTSGAVVGATIVGLKKLADITLIARIRNAASRFNVRRVVTLLAWLVVALVVVSVLFVNWYTAETTT